MQQLLEDYILSLRATGDPETGGNAKGGAIAVLDARSGAVLALATYPSYDISTYYEDYADLLAAENTPLINRAVDGLYRPGSTFKPVVAAAALGEGVISPADTVSCTGVYTYYDTVIEGNTFRPTCLGVHGGDCASRRAAGILQHLLLRRRPPDGDRRDQQEYAENCGLGVSTGLELGGARRHPHQPGIYRIARRHLDPGQRCPGLDRPDGHNGLPPPDGGRGDDHRQPRHPL